ncbi:MAG: hypothetical protein ACRERE_28175 [Candidatus Entotheonellia bacterium]
MIKGDKTITAGVCGGQGGDDRPLDPVSDRLDVQIAPDPQWARRKFDEERSVGMHVLIAHAPEADTGHRSVQL